MLIRKVWIQHFNDTLHITIPDPNPEEISGGDYVIIKKYRPKLKDGICSKCGKAYVKHTIEELEQHDLLQKMVKK
jgi:hypothetical protein